MKEPDVSDGEIRGAIVCSLCDCVIAEDVRLQWQEVTCPGCHAVCLAPGPGESPAVQAAQLNYRNAMAQVSSGVGLIVFWLIYSAGLSNEAIPIDSWEADDHRNSYWIWSSILCVFHRDVQDSTAIIK